MTLTPPLRVVCAWCEAERQQRESTPDALVSHGICDEHARRMLAERAAQMPKEETP